MLPLDYSSMSLSRLLQMKPHIDTPACKITISTLNYNTIKN